MSFPTLSSLQANCTTVTVRTDRGHIGEVLPNLRYHVERLLRVELCREDLDVGTEVRYLPIIPEDNTAGVVLSVTILRPLRRQVYGYWDPAELTLLRLFVLPGFGDVGMAATPAQIPQNLVTAGPAMRRIVGGIVLPGNKVAYSAAELLASLENPATRSQSLVGLLWAIRDAVAMISGKPDLKIAEIPFTINFGGLTQASGQTYAVLVREPPLVMEVTERYDPATMTSRWDVKYTGNNRMSVQSAGNHTGQPAEQPAIDTGERTRSILL